MAESERRQPVQHALQIEQVCDFAVALRLGLGDAECALWGKANIRRHLELSMP